MLQELPHVWLHQGDADALLPAAGSPVHALLVIVVHQPCKHSHGQHALSPSGVCPDPGNAVLPSSKILLSFSQRSLEKGLALLIIKATEGQSGFIFDPQRRLALYEIYI